MIISSTCRSRQFGRGRGGAFHHQKHTDPFSFKAQTALQGLRVALGALTAPRQRVHLPAQRSRLLLQLLALLLLLKSGLHHAHTQLLQPLQPNE